MNKRSFFISVFTVFVQYYDYHLYGFLAAKISLHFFPADDVVKRMLSTYLIMALAMIAKPIGSVLLGRIGDERGRSVSFSISLCGTALGSLILFLTPSFSSVGYAAILLLLAGRMLICASASSGSDGVRIFIYENVTKSRQCFGVGVTSVFTQAGTLLGALAAFATTLDALPEYAWKFSFLFGTIMASLLLLLLRLIEIDEDALKAKRQMTEFRELSIKTAIMSNLKLFITCIFLAGAIGGTNQFIIIFFGTYCFEILQIVDRSLMKTYIAVAILVYMMFSIVAGFIADRIIRIKVVYFGVIGALIMSALLAASLSSARASFSPALYFGITFFLPFITMPGAAIYKEAIPIEIRYRLFSLSHAIGSIFISAPTAFLSTLFFDLTDSPAAPIGYFISIIIIIGGCLVSLNKQRGQ